jgi:hypothetical protein
VGGEFGRISTAISKSTEEAWCMRVDAVSQMIVAAQIVALALESDSGRTVELTTLIRASERAWTTTCRPMHKWKTCICPAIPPRMNIYFHPSRLDLKEI